MATCRVCKKSDESYEQMFKYSTRHYAHGKCGIQKWGAAFLSMIPKHRIGHLPYFALEKAGLLDAALKANQEE